MIVNHLSTVLLFRFKGKPMIDQKNINIRDIAQALNVSTSTVSAALNGTWEKRRVKQETAERIQECAAQMGYRVNLQARALRTSNSGLVALIMPEHNNRFFSDLAQFFSAEARARNLCPVIVSTERNSEEEIETVHDLARFSIDSLFVAGAVSPEKISAYCRASKIAHVFIDQPCADAPSVVTDNYAGSQKLTQAILEKAKFDLEGQRNHLYFFGGDARLYASSQRVRGFEDFLKSQNMPLVTNQVLAKSYDTRVSEAEFQNLYERLGGLPAALYINSLSALEGAMRFLSKLPNREIDACTIGCFDYDPMLQFNRFPMFMIRQRFRLLVRTAFQVLDDPTGDVPMLQMIEPELSMSCFNTA